MTDDTIARVVRRVPVDATAARVVSAGPKGVESDKRFGGVCAPAPPQMREVPAGTPNRIGFIKGHLTVVGLSVARKPSDKQTKWVCRCRCGYYVIRLTRKLREQDPALMADRCDRCRQVWFLKKRSFYQQTGRDPLPSEIE